MSFPHVNPADVDLDAVTIHNLERVVTIVREISTQHASGNLTPRLYDIITNSALSLEDAMVGVSDAHQSLLLTLLEPAKSVPGNAQVYTKVRLNEGIVTCYVNGIKQHCKFCGAVADYTYLNHAVGWEYACIDDFVKHTSSTFRLIRGNKYILNYI
jgi:hypothetical protein